MNAVGERTLEYLRGEKDLLEERKRVAEVKKQVEPSNLSYWVTGMSKRRLERFWQIVLLLQENSRMSLVEMSRKLNVPVSTLFDTLKEVEKLFHFTIILREPHAPDRENIPVEPNQWVSTDLSERNEPHTGSSANHARK